MVQARAGLDLRQQQRLVARAEQGDAGQALAAPPLGREVSGRTRSSACPADSTAGTITPSTPASSTRASCAPSCDASRTSTGTGLTWASGATSATSRSPCWTSIPIQSAPQPPATSRPNGLRNVSHSPRRPAPPPARICPAKLVMPPRVWLPPVWLPPVWLPRVWLPRVWLHRV
jgi:hypothetical protein